MTENEILQEKRQPNCNRSLTSAVWRYVGQSQQE